MGFFSKISAGLKKTRDSFAAKLSALAGSFRKVDEELFDELEELLIASDVGAPCAAEICDRLRTRAKTENITDPEAIRAALREIIAQMLSGDNEMHLSTRPSVILVIGVNGAGKTTTIGKMAALYKAQGKSVLVAAADTFRAAAVEQLEIWTKRAGVPIVKAEQGSDPAAVVFDAAQAAKARAVDILLVDTAGRLHNKKNLMDELAKIGRVIERELPGADCETLLVVDGVTGQNAVLQAREFAKACPVSGLVVTKLDGTAKGGIMIPIRAELHLPVKFLTVGEQIGDIEPFDPEAYAAALFEE